MKLSKIETALLAGIARTIDHWRTLSIRFPNDTAADTARWRAETHHKTLAAADAANVDLGAFLGVSPTASETVQASRAYRRLEGLGLIERLTGRFSDRTAAIRLLPPGRSLVDSLSPPPAAEAEHHHGE